ncbi:type III secretion system gatekeeper subunit SctW [Trinickia sp. EG282A]|uniref:type III secretion system gatekeeper subunit SctW n=1 Tax=Trinickia sp. EG282A TaxID=3237013 RepID=UPI0034D19E35
MIVDKVNASGCKPQTAQALQPSQPAVPADASQAFPANSVFEIAQNELSSNPGEFASLQASLSGIDKASYTETVEDIGFAIGARARESRALKEGRADKTRAKAMLGKLAEVATEHADELRARVPEIEQSPAPYDEMRRAKFDAGEMALVLAACLGGGKLDEKARRRLEDALSTVMESEEWVLLLFNHLEFGAAGRAGLTELRELYRRASAQRPRLAQWFEQLRGLADRKRKLKTLIRALAFELSAEGPATGAQLAAVIGDLKRILQFLGMEDHCERLARSLHSADVDGDTVLGLLIDAVQEVWLDKSWIADRTGALINDETQQYVLVQRLNEVAKLLPDDCFNDGDQRDTMLEAFSGCLDMLAD